MKWTHDGKKTVLLIVIAVLWIYGGWKGWPIVSRLFRSEPVAYQISSVQVVPDGIEVAEPISLSSLPFGGKESDRYSEVLCKLSADPSSSREKVLCDNSELERLFKEDQALLSRYLACHPGWRFRDGRYGREARRRIRKGDLWIDRGWGYFRQTQLDDEECESIEATCVVYLDGIDDSSPRYRCGECAELESIVPGEDDFNDWQIMCGTGTNVTLVVSEHTSFKRSRVIQPIFDFTREEFGAVRQARNWETAKGLLPEGTIHKGISTVDVYEDEPGGYFYRAWINPMEPGKVYLKVYDIMNGTSLSQELIRQMSEEYVGWSDNSAEKFCVGSPFCIVERCNASSCVVRLEVWFVPAGGGPERKLIERVFKVKGQER